MFSGLGSGIGSTPQPGHVPLKRPLTPTRIAAGDEVDAERGARRPNPEAEVSKPASTTSRAGRNAKRPVDDDGRPDGDGTGGRATPATSTRGKRNKYTLPPGHHHHPLPTTHR